MFEKHLWKSDILSKDAGRKCVNENSWKAYISTKYF